tara:strand:- start:865 stop:1359 length:495 start_codon:yes stop_codon:yes gene_type:complete
MNRIIITAIGRDRPGLVNKITSIINNNDGNIENSKMIKIDDQFAIIINFCLLGDIKNIEDELTSIKKLSFFCKKTDNTKASEKIEKKYLVKGADDQGIIDTVSNYFKDNQINITEIDTFVEPAPITGSPLFNMKIRIESNAENLNNIREDLIKICKKLNLDLSE